MDSILFLQAFLSLAFVIGLVFVVFWLIKFLESKSIRNPFLKKNVGDNHLKILEAKRLDARNTLTLVRCDEEEYLLLLGNSQNLLLNTKKVKKND